MTTLTKQPFKFADMKAHGFLPGFLGLTFLSMILSTFTSSAFAQGIPPGVNPGALMQYQIQNQKIEGMNPWLKRPINPEDVKRPESPEIQFTKQEVQGVIDLKQNSTTPIVPEQSNPDDPVTPSSDPYEKNGSPENQSGSGTPNSK
ncbi:MAG: hypothetical protein K2X66_09925 [Cyanobacteria bacterium]|nr:hypothetical protein [Cyanobacteriota bacterium]